MARMRGVLGTYVNKGLVGRKYHRYENGRKALDTAAHHGRRFSEACTSASSNALDLVDRLVIEALNGKTVLHSN